MRAAQQQLGIQPRRIADRRQPGHGAIEHGIDAPVFVLDSWLVLVRCYRVHSRLISNVTDVPMNVYSNILDMVGKTPMLEVTHIDTGPCRLFLKLELMNPGRFDQGSHRHLDDRRGRKTRRHQARRHAWSRRLPAIPASGWRWSRRRKAISLVLVLPDKMSQEKIFNLRAMGAEVVLTRSDVGRGHPEYYQDLGKRIAEEQGAYFINQFGNPDNPLAHEQTTAPEIVEQMGGDLDAIVLGVGSSGTVSGIGKYLAEHAPERRSDSRRSGRLGADRLH